MAHEETKATPDPYPTSELPEHAQPEQGGTGWPGGAERPADAPDEPRPPQQIVVKTGGGILRGLFFATATVAAVVAVVLGLTLAGIVPNLQNPFGGRTTDRSQPVLLKSIKDLNRFVAAQGDFQVIVDLQQDKKYVPDFLYNDRTLFVAAGQVDAYVDFTRIGAGAITESADHKTATIKLPAPQLNKPNLDHDKSYVFAQQQGAINKLGNVFSNDPNKLNELYKLGEQKIADAAKQGELDKRAQDNTTRMLEGMLRSLGYTSVTVTYASP
jgi:hypothetical protein